jgi:hypothetical protein
MASKIRDGLFIGDATACKDVEFVRLNKIFAIVNTAGKELPSHFQQPTSSHGNGHTVAHTANYMMLPWEDDGSFPVFGADDTELISVCMFIDRAYRRGDSVLICSVRGNCRAAGTDHYCC